MKVYELIDILKTMPQDYDIAINDEDNGNFFVGDNKVDFELSTYTDNSEGEAYVIISLGGLQV